MLGRCRPALWFNGTSQVRFGLGLKLALRGGGRVWNVQKKTLRNTWMAPNRDQAMSHAEYKFSPINPVACFRTVRPKFMKLSIGFGFSNVQGSKLTLAPSPEASGNRGGWVEFLHRSSAGRVDISIYFVNYMCLRMNQTTEISVEWQLIALPITKITL